MSEQDRFKEIAKVAADANVSIIGIINGLSDLVYQLGYIEGLSYVSEEEE